MSLFSCQYSYLPLFDHRGIYRAKSICQICQKRPVTKELPLLGALSFNGAGERTSAYPLRGFAPASAACRRPRQLAKNAPRFLGARSFAGSSPRDGPKTKKPPLLGAFQSMVRAKGLEPSWGCPHTDLNRTRLPIPPRPRAGIRITERHRERKNYF